jgi:hypothetical protein
VQLCVWKSCKEGIRAFGPFTFFDFALDAKNLHGALHRCMSIAGEWVLMVVELIEGADEQKNGRVRAIFGRVVFVLANGTIVH